MEKKIDPLRMEVIKNAFISITEEMSATLYRSAYSTNIKTRKDYSCALFDKELKTIAQSFSQPPHLGAMARLVPTAIKSYGEEKLGEGDTIIINDEEFNRMRTEIPILVDHNEGIINIQDIQKTFDNQDYIRILDEIYSNSRISFKFRNLRIFPQKLREKGITVIDEYRRALSETEPIEIILNYQEIDLSYLLESFSEMRLRCIDVSKKELGDQGQRA